LCTPGFPLNTRNLVSLCVHALLIGIVVTPLGIRAGRKARLAADGGPAQCADPGPYCSPDACIA
jgi:hypothetical protein